MERKLQKVEKSRKRTYSAAFFVIAAVFLVSVIGYSYTANVITELDYYDEFAQCIDEKGVIMYGSIRCSHCQNQKDAFGSSFQYITYVECPDNPSTCENAGISGYPTWVIDNQKYPGAKEMEVLASLTGCELPS